MEFTLHFPLQSKYTAFIIEQHKHRGRYIQRDSKRWTQFRNSILQN